MTKYYIHYFANDPEIGVYDEYEVIPAETKIEAFTKFRRKRIKGLIDIDTIKPEYEMNVTW